MTERSAEAPDSRPGVHELLLELAGRLDDDLLAWARELVAVGEEGQAVELAVAALVAERVALPPAVRTAVVQAGHTDLDANAQLAPATADDATGHRFDAAARSGDRIAAVLAALPARRLAGCTLHLTWRLTPAGTAPGPVPRAVVLVETGPDRSADVLAYLLATELDRAGAPASVEVVATGADLPAYHVAALRSARRIEVGASVIAPAGVVVARTTAEAAPAEEGTPAEVGTDTAALLVMPSADEGEARRGGRRRRKEPAAAAPETAGDPLDDAPVTDPFHGPLRVPLLEPLLDPTARDGDEAPPAVPTPIRPVPAQPADGPDEAPAAPAPEVPDEVPQEWEEDWRSGDWAIPPTGLPQPSDSFDVFAPQDDGNAIERTGRTELPAPADPEAELPSRSRAKRRPDEARPAPEPFEAGTDGTAALPSRRDKAPEGPQRRPDVSLFDSPTARVGPPPRPASAPERPADVSLFGEPARPQPAPDEPSADGEPSVLSSTERDLLAQLQAELADRERRPRPYRRARSTAAPGVNGHGVNGRGVNGHASDDPDDPGPGES